MATVTDVEVANASFPNVRQDLNDILEALATNFSADAEPSTMYANQFWYETDTNLLKFRNEDNDAWITLAYFDQTADEWEVRSAVMQAVDAAGLAFKTDEGTTRLSISDAGQVSFQNYSFPTADGTSGQVLTTDGAGNLSFGSAAGGDSISEGNSSVEVVDTGTGRVSITVDGTETARFDDNGRLGMGSFASGGAPSVLSFGSFASPTATPSGTYSDYAISLYGSTTTSQIRNFIGAGESSAVAAGIGFVDDGGGGAQGITFATGNLTTISEAGRFDASGNLHFNSGYGSSRIAYGCRAWVNFDGTGTVAIRASGNVSSITDVGTGSYKANFATSMPDNNYAVGGLFQPTVTNNGSDTFADFSPSNTAQVTVAHYEDGTARDSNWVSLIVFR